MLKMSVTVAAFNEATAASLLPSRVTMAPHADGRQRLVIHELKRIGSSQKEIAQQTGFLQQQVSYILRCPVTPKKRQGRPAKITTPGRKLLIDFIKASPANRHLPIAALAEHFGTGLEEQAIRTALEKKNMGRR
jgi:transposase